MCFFYLLNYENIWNRCNKHLHFVLRPDKQILELDSLQLRTESEGVLFLSGDSESLRDVLRGDAVKQTHVRELTAVWRLQSQPHCCKKAQWSGSDSDCLTGSEENNIEVLDLSQTLTAEVLGFIKFFWERSFNKMCS